MGIKVVSNSEVKKYMRRNFYEIIKGAGINITNEYNRINELFESTELSADSVRDSIESAFLDFPKSFRGRTVSLDDFDSTYGFKKIGFASDVSIEELLSRCEYITNLCNQLCKCWDSTLDVSDWLSIRLLTETIEGCIDELGFVPAKIEDFVIYVEKDSAAISVAEIVPEQLAFVVLEYNHHKLKGDLNKKRQLLKEMADNIEPERKRLRSINSTLETQLCQLMNKFIRHDHSQTPFIVTMKKQEIESTYDDIYQMWLLAKLELDNLERKNRMQGLLEKINS